jgi:hypothetical protein
MATIPAGHCFVYFTKPGDFSTCHYAQNKGPTVTLDQSGNGSGVWVGIQDSTSGWNYGYVPTSIDGGTQYGSWAANNGLGRSPAGHPYVKINFLTPIYNSDGTWIKDVQPGTLVSLGGNMGSGQTMWTSFYEWSEDNGQTWQKPQAPYTYGWVDCTNMFRETQTEGMLTTAYGSM